MSIASSILLALALAAPTSGAADPAIGVSAAPSLGVADAAPGVSAAPSPGAADAAPGVSAAPSGAPADTSLALFSWEGHRVGGGVELETSLLWPFVPGGLFQLKAAVPVAERGHLLLGAQLDLPEDRPDEGEFSNVAVNLGWRQYLWAGLHVDGLLNLGYGRLRNNVLDGTDHDSFDMEVMALAGWRLELGPVYALVQPAGIGLVFFKSDPWRIRGRGGRPRVEDPIYVGNLLLGVQL